jgi:predicted RNA-binding protein
MCEFKVYLKSENKEETVAEDIVYVKDEGSSVVLKTILGNKVTIDHVDIVEVDVEAERLVLLPHTHYDHHHH